MSSSTAATVATVESYAAARPTLVRGVAVVVIGAVLFFVALAALIDFREFIAGPGDGTMSGDELVTFRAEMLPEHHTQVVLGYTLIGLGQLLLGFGTAIQAVAIARAETRRRARIATWAARVLMLGGILSCLTYAWPGYWRDDETLLRIGETTRSASLFTLTWVVLAAGFLILAALVATGPPWPRWTAVVLTLFALLPFVTLLPLFFQLGAIVAGLGLAIGTRPTRLARLSSPPGAPSGT